MNLKPDFIRVFPLSHDLIVAICAAQKFDLLGGWSLTRGDNILKKVTNSRVKSTNRRYTLIRLPHNEIQGKMQKKPRLD